eukprot:6437194-Pyramimonas_sp.AAC.1
MARTVFAGSEHFKNRVARRILSSDVRVSPPSARLETYADAPLPDPLSRAPIIYAPRAQPKAGSKGKGKR